MKVPPPSRDSLTSRDAFLDSVFSFNIVVRETNPNVRHTPNLSSYPEVVNRTYDQLLCNDSNFNKLWTRESFQYYCVNLLWMRIISLKMKLRHKFTPAERSIANKCNNYAFNTPEPIRLYLASIGAVQTKAGHHLYPEFPAMPEEIVDHTPGYYAQSISACSHNLYEEVPCIGIVVALLKASLNEVRPFPQPNLPIVPQNMTANANLCFYHKIVPPREEAKQILYSAGVSFDHFPCAPAGTGFNFELLISLSSIFATTSTFKNTAIVFRNMPEQGYICQTIPTHPTKDNDETDRHVTATVIPRCLNRESPIAFGMAIAFGFHLWKEPFGEEPHHETWCCVTAAADHLIPNSWIDNRNERRNLPVPYESPFFVGTTSNMADILKNGILELVKTKH